MFIMNTIVNCVNVCIVKFAVSNYYFVHVLFQIIPRRLGNEHNADGGIPSDGNFTLFNIGLKCIECINCSETTRKEHFPEIEGSACTRLCTETNLNARNRTGVKCCKCWSLKPRYLFPKINNDKIDWKFFNRFHQFV